jgi:hypothetical protein
VRTNALRLHTERSQQVAHGVNVCNVWNIRQAVFTFCQQGDGHQFENRILGSRNLYLALKRFGMLNDNLHDAISMLAQWQ